MAIDILRHEEDGIEFFTVAATGESGMSVSGLARLCGVKQHSVTQLHKALITSSCPECLQPFAGQELALIPSSRNNRKIIRDDVCAATIEYYAFESQRKTEEALFAFRKFARSGVRSWIQSTTGWTPETRSVRLILGDIVQRDPLPWESHFGSNWIAQAQRLTGWDWNYRVMGKFIKANVYDLMPTDVQVFLDECNPMDEQGRRPNFQYQHFKAEADAVLKSHIKTVEDLMQSSVSLQMFNDLMRARFQGLYQLEFVIKLPKLSA